MSRSYLFEMLGKSEGAFVKVMQMQHWMPNEFGPPFCMGTPSDEKHAINMAAIIKVERK